ncbi:hypothetical protein V1507DRAFT_461064 [Lipomyces tetrasporus]
MSVTDSEVLSNYNKAFTLLKENTPEQRLDVQLPYDKFSQLDEAFSELKSAEGISEDQRYPSLAYNSFTETVTLVPRLSEHGQYKEQESRIWQELFEIPIIFPCILA